MKAAPMPMIVGVGRSGTTLLRLMLEAHSQMAIPPETGFLPKCAKLIGTDKTLRDAFFELVVGFPSWPDFHLSSADFNRELDRIHPFNIPDGLRCIYKLYAQRFN
jgi:hypothetical protein